MKTKVKICGITRIEDVKTLNKYLPDYVGFVFAPSRRRIESEKAAELISELDARIKKVGVFLNHSQRDVEDIAYKCSLDVLQFHGDETAQYCASFEQKVWKAIGIKNAQSLKRIEHFQVDGILLDSIVDGKSGGTGQPFDWQMVSCLPENVKVILAGGLNSRNILEAIEKVKPYCVDISSGVETDGVKDTKKIKEFVELVKGVII